jgi:uncharacterized protein YeaO (DUF488 family)
MVRIKRAYREASPSDGIRILVDRVWPRGITKKRARIVEWRKDLAPSASLRKWFGHDPTRWNLFRRRYRTELKRSMEDLQKLACLSSKQTVTLVYSAAHEFCGNIKESDHECHRESNDVSTEAAKPL